MSNYYIQFDKNIKKNPINIDYRIDKDDDVIEDGRFIYFKYKPADFGLQSITNPMEQIAGKFLLSLDANNDLGVVPIAENIDYLKSKRKEEFLPLVTSSEKNAILKFDEIVVRDNIEKTHEVFLRKKNNGLTFTYIVPNSNVSIINIPVALASQVCSMIENYRTNLKVYKERYIAIIDAMQTTSELKNLTFGSLQILGQPFDGTQDVVFDFTPVNRHIYAVNITGMAVANSITGEILQQF